MKRILLAEDEEVLRMLVVDTLEDEDYRIDEACDGQEAIEMLQTNSYDLILLDYMMPVLSGIELIVRLRMIDTHKSTPVMMLSAKSQKADQDKVIEAGADFFMAKPFSPIELADRVKEIIQSYDEVDRAKVI